MSYENSSRFSWRAGGVPAFARLHRHSATYGSLGSGVALLLYLLISSTVPLLGAGVNAEVYHEVEGEEGSEAVQPTVTDRSGTYRPQKP